MKVKISYTAEIEDILLEVAHIFDNMDDRIRSTHDSLHKVLKNLRGDNFNFNEAVEDIHQIRTNYAKLDLRVAEALDVIRGHDQYQHALHTLDDGAGDVSEQPGEENND